MLPIATWYNTGLLHKIRFALWSRERKDTELPHFTLLPTINIKICPEEGYTTDNVSSHLMPHVHAHTTTTELPHCFSSIF